MKILSENQTHAIIWCLQQCTVYVDKCAAASATHAFILVIADGRNQGIQQNRHPCEALQIPKHQTQVSMSPTHILHRISTPIWTSNNHSSMSCDGSVAVLTLKRGQATRKYAMVRNMNAVVNPWKHGKTFMFIHIYTHVLVSVKESGLCAKAG